MPQEAFVVHKFGGTSVAGAERYKNIPGILAAEPGKRKGVVVSAMAKVTDSLINLLDLAKSKDETYVAKLKEIKDRHIDTINQLLTGPKRDELAKVFETDAGQIGEVLRAVYLGRSYSEATMELVSGYGEVWSAQILNAYYNSIGQKCAWLDAREVLVVRQTEMGPSIEWKDSTAKINAWLKKNPTDLIIITGYIASTPEGVPTTLKRNGSDFSAAIFGALLDASVIVIWTDVDGVLSADPRRVPEAVVLTEMSYNEAMELAYFGAKVIHPKTMAPALAKGIPIYIRNTFNSKHPGTKIHKGTSEGPDTVPVKGFSTVDKVSLINVEGTGLIGVPGTASRLFGSLREVGISVIMISQASSEHSICFAVPEAQGALAKQTVEKSFMAELTQGAIQKIDLVEHCSILAAVGDRMVKTPGVAANFFSALGKAGVSIRAIAQGSSERNISVIVDENQSTRALRAAHSGFYLSNQTLSIGILGPGLIGRALLKQLEAQAPRLKSEFKIDLRVRAIANSKKMLLNEKRVDLASWQKEFESTAKDMNLEAFTEHVQTDFLPHSVIIDCSASDQLASYYPKWLERRIHVITPNKKANSGKLAYYKDLREICRRRQSHFLYEATVGAGLPIITTLRDLVQTGDQILEIEGILSGTLSYIFNSLKPGKSFSEIVREAAKLGYTEPDPRDDLSGTDVARKLIILSREMGLSLELDGIKVQSLVAEPLRAVKSVDEFLSRLPEFDDEIAERQKTAAAKNEVLRYVGITRPAGPSTVELKSYPMTHPFARLTGSDNIIAFRTARYNTQPLLVQGPGAGPEVTAGGIFGDLLRLNSFLGSAP